MARRLIDFISQFGNMKNLAILLVITVIRCTLFFFMCYAMAWGEYSEESILFEQPFISFSLMTLLRLATLICMNIYISKYSKKYSFTPFVLPISLLPAFFINFYLLGAIQQSFGLSGTGILMLMWIELFIVTPIIFSYQCILATIASRKNTL